MHAVHEVMTRTKHTTMDFGPFRDAIAGLEKDLEDKEELRDLALDDNQAPYKNGKIELVPCKTREAANQKAQNT